MSDLSHISDEAVDLAHDISWGGEHANRHHIRMMLAAALPVLNTAKDSETARVDELDRWLNAGDVAGYASVEDLLNAMRVRRASLRGKQ